MKAIYSFAKGIAVISLLVLPLVPGGVSAAASTWNDPNFQSVWERTDKPVQDGVVSRSWMWGPETVPGSPSSEPYAEAPGGSRVVQYFDKSRMEVNDPAGDRSQLWFVTNGLLVREMVSGRIQMGNSAFTNVGASQEAVAGDPASVNPNAPTYASFSLIASLNNDHPSTPKTGGAVLDFVNKNGVVTTAANASASPDSSVTYAYFEPNLKHNIPNVFWDFLNGKGLTYSEGEPVVDTVVDWVFAMGYPITEPYWTTVRVGGADKNVVVQLFERRVLTYTPSNSPAYQVEMGNVGQHYKRWRYEAPPAEDRIAFVSNRSGSGQIWTMKSTGGDLKQLTDSAGENVWPSWSPDNSKIVFRSNRDGNWEIYVMNADGSGQQRLTFDGANVDEDPAWSPDGLSIVWSKNGDIYTMASNGGDVQQVTSGGPLERYPLYSPDGQWFAISTFEPGNYEIYKIRPDGSEPTRLTYRDVVQDFPTDWRSGKMLFGSVGPGGAEVRSMDDDGGNQINVASDALRGAYSSDGTKIVVDMDSEVWVMNADGTDPVNITNASFYDGQPDWSN